MGSVVNGDGSFRVINDLSFPHDDPSTPSVNSFVDAEDFKTSWGAFNLVVQFFKTTEGPFELAIYDWAKAYRQVMTLQSQWRYLLVMDLDGYMWIDTRVQFGGVAGCGVFGQPADLWKDIVQKSFNLTEVFRWVDDNLMIKVSSNKTSI